jgi:D-serine deaminase-like pyridoxal phosphate-dependent protein
VLVDDLPTPALVVDVGALTANLATMAAACPGNRLRPHVKAHKCTSLARLQAEHGHTGFTCATPREALGMAAAGLGEDLLVANEVLDLRRLRDLSALADSHAIEVTVAVDSDATVRAAATAGIRQVLIDVNVGLPRCGCRPTDAGALADLARSLGLTVRGVMGYEGHVMTLEPLQLTDRMAQAEVVALAMDRLRAAHDQVGGDVISAGGTGTYDLHEHTGVTEVQAGSYVLMDTHYARLGLPFVQALHVIGTVISVAAHWAVADVGLKALGMDHGPPLVPGHRVLVVSDEHLTFSPDDDSTPRHRVGDRVEIVPAHVDPTVAMHETLWLVDGEQVVEGWPVDLRGW